MKAMSGGGRGWAGVAPMALAIGLMASSAASAKVTITFWHNWSGAGGKVMAGLAEHYNKTHPDVVVKLSQMADTYQKLLVSTAAGTAPDTVVLDRYLTAQYASKGILQKLDSYMAASGLKAGMFPKAAMDEATYKGGTYSIPMTVDSRTMWYNKNLFEKAGLDPSKPPTTWDQARAYAEKLTQRNADGKLTQVGFGPFAEQGGVLIQWLWQNGADVFNADRTKVTYNSADSVAALKWGLDLEDFYGKGAGSFPSNMGGFYLGKTAMVLSGPWMESDLIKNGPKGWQNSIEFGPVPYFKAPAVLIGGMGLVVPALSRHKKEAWDFIHFIMSQDEQVYFGVNNGTTPALLSAAHSKEYMNDRFRVAHVDALDVTRARPAHPSYPDIETQLNAGFNAARAKTKSLQQGLDSTIKAAQTILDVANKRMAR